MFLCALTQPPPPSFSSAQKFPQHFLCTFSSAKIFSCIISYWRGCVGWKKILSKDKASIFSGFAAYTRDHDCILYLIHVELLYTSKEALLVLSSVHYYSFRRFSTSFNIAMSNRHQKNCFVMFSLPKKNLPFSYGIIHRRWSLEPHGTCKAVACWKLHSFKKSPN